MDDDGVNIIACLKTSITDATLIWKSQTPSEGSGGSFCGAAMAQGYAYTGTWYFSNVAKCNGQDIAIPGAPFIKDASNNIVGGGPTGGMKCPSGYIPVPLSVATPWSNESNYFTCVKQ
ncbi:MAG: hypothetical protein WC464_00390 [Bdellovibrionales bacterium]